MQRDVVLDPKTGLPEVRASRSQDGQVTFRVHVLQAGGGSIFTPVNDATHQLIREQYGEPAADWEERLKRVQEAYALVIEDASPEERAAAAKLAELTDEHAALSDTVVEERVRADEAEQRAAEVERELIALREQVKQTTPAAMPETKPRTTAGRGKQAA